MGSISKNVVVQAHLSYEATTGECYALHRLRHRCSLVVSEPGQNASKTLGTPASFGPAQECDA